MPGAPWILDQARPGKHEPVWGQCLFGFIVEDIGFDGLVYVLAVFKHMHVDKQAVPFRPELELAGIYRATGLEPNMLQGFVDVTGLGKSDGNRFVVVATFWSNDKELGGFKGGHAGSYPPEDHFSLFFVGDYVGRTEYPRQISGGLPGFACRLFFFFGSGFDFFIGGRCVLLIAEGRRKFQVGEALVGQPGCGPTRSADQAAYK